MYKTVMGSLSTLFVLLESVALTFAEWVILFADFCSTVSYWFEDRAA